MEDYLLVALLAGFMLGDAFLASLLAWWRVRAGFHDPAFWDATLAAALEALEGASPAAKARLAKAVESLFTGGGAGGPGRAPSFNQMLKFGLLNLVTRGRFGAMMGMGGSAPPAPEGEGVGGGEGAPQTPLPARSARAGGRLGGLRSAFRGR